MSRAPKNLTYEKVYNHAYSLFGHDKDKTNVWWMGKQELLDNMSPYEMVKEGKGRKLMKILERCGI